MIIAWFEFLVWHFFPLTHFPWLSPHICKSKALKCLLNVPSRLPRSYVGTDSESSCLSNYLLSNLHPQSDDQWCLLFYFFLYFWNRILITKFLPFLSFLQTPTYTPPEFPQSIHSFFTDYYCMHTWLCMYVCMYSDAVCWVCSVLFLSMSSGSTICLWHLYFITCFSMPSILTLTHLHEYTDDLGWSLEILMDPSLYDSSVIPYWISLFCNLVEF